MTEKPILFSAPMVRAILSGAKTQTRRVVKAPNGSVFDSLVRMSRGDYIRCPYSDGSIGSRLWVRETWRPFMSRARDGRLQVEYRADDSGGAVNAPPEVKTGSPFEPWHPSIHMPRWASRITLEVTGIRGERLQDITEEDARAEGLPWSDGNPGPLGPTSMVVEAKNQFRHLWYQLNGSESWSANPWVWVVEFKRLTQ